MLLYAYSMLLYTTGDQPPPAWRPPHAGAAQPAGRPRVAGGAAAHVRGAGVRGVIQAVGVHGHCFALVCFSRTLPPAPDVHLKSRDGDVL